MKPIISSIIYLVVLLALSEFVFDPTHLYYELPWLDVPMHVMGGFGVASLVMSIAAYKKNQYSFVTVLLLYVGVAICWELYEYVHDLMLSQAWNGWPDTFSDVVNGAFGMFAAYYLLKK